MIKVNNKKTAIVGGVVGIVLLLTIFCCEGKNEEVTPVEEAVEEVVAPIEEAAEDMKEAVKDAIGQPLPITPSTEDVE